jgi:hypothetical protein
MWNEAVDHLVPLSLVSMAVRRVARELEQNAKYEAERQSRRYSNDGLIDVWWGKIKQYKAQGLRSVAIIMKFPLKLLTHGGREGGWAGWRTVRSFGPRSNE